MVPYMEIEYLCSMNFVWYKVGGYFEPLAQYLLSKAYCRSECRLHGQSWAMEMQTECKLTSHSLRHIKHTC
jgi:hypothetical protein